MRTSRVLGVGIGLVVLLGATLSNLASAASSSCPSCVTISPHGTPDRILDRDGGYGAVRFDPPFRGPYTIRSVAFPSFTSSGAPAHFPSVRLCGTDAIGRPNIAVPLLVVAPFEGSADGTNTIPIDLVVTEPGRTFFWVVEFPRRAASGVDQPFMRADLADMEAGFFASTYNATPSGLVSSGGGGNWVVDMTCEVPSSNFLPIASPSNLGANWRGNRMEFSFRPSPDPGLRQTILMYRGDFGSWRTFASVGRGTDVISVPIDSIPRGARIWAVAARDRLGNFSVQSSTVIAPPITSNRSEFTYDAYEPNGDRSEAETLDPTVIPTYAAIFPAGDRDCYRLEGTGGDVIHAAAYAVIVTPALDHLRLALALYDHSGRRVAFKDGSIDDLPPRIDYTVPTQPGNAPSKEYILEVFDPRGSSASPDMNRRSAINGQYGIIASVEHSQFLARYEAPPKPSEPELSPRSLPGGSIAFRITIPSGASAAKGVLQIFDVRGRLVSALGVRGDQGGGSLTTTWDGRGAGRTRVTSGIYFARLVLGGQATACKVILSK